MHHTLLISFVVLLIATLAAAFGSTPESCPTCSAVCDSIDCDQAEPQSPRDLSTGAEGEMTPRSPALTSELIANMVLTNVHYHLGAEHKSDEYNDGTKTEEYNAGKSESSLRPGWMCSNEGLDEGYDEHYEFKYCKDVEAGNSYEMHWVHSSAGATSYGEDREVNDLISDGLGSAAQGRGLLNPMIIVRAIVLHVVNDDKYDRLEFAPGGEFYDNVVSSDFQRSYEFESIELYRAFGLTKMDFVRYSGSTTGTSYDNEMCSAYVSTWHVGLPCVKISAKSFDDICNLITISGEEDDVEPHGSRMLVDEKYAVKSSYVFKKI